MRAIVLRLAILVVTPACGSDKDSAFSPSGASDYCEAIEPFFCSFYVRCGRMDVTTQAECKAAFLPRCNAVFEPRYIGLEAAGLLELDLAGIDACRAHLDSVACDQQTLELAGPCQAMWRGTQPAGAACGFDVETFVCEPGSECVLGLDLCGECRPAVAVGATCTPGTDVCEGDAYCDDGICVAFRRNGETCTPDDRCLIGSACESGVCTPPTFVARGEACNARNRCPYLTACIGGTCQSTSSLGAACTNDGVCEIGACDGGVCVAPRPDGDACERPAQCSSGLCTDMLCQPRPSVCIAP